MTNSVVVSLEFRFFMTEDGQFWTDSVNDNRFWQRYLDIFDTVYIVARVKKVAINQENWKSVGSDKIKFLPLSYYVGPIQMVKKLFRLNRELDKIGDLPYHFILRVPSFIGILLYRKLLKKNKKFALEVVGDPDDVFRKKTLQVQYVNFYRWLFVRELKLQCDKASAISYVTSDTLQKKYPANNNASVVACSDIELPDYFYTKPFRDFSQKKSFRLLFIGSLAQKYKGLDILLNALASPLLKDMVLHLTVLGDGKYRAEYEDLSLQLGIEEQIVFQGYITDTEEIYKSYLSADIFILPSLTEGLPRVIIEAMATSLPVIATSVGGIPELLDDTSLVEAGDVDQLAQKIYQFTHSFELLESEAQRNYLHAKQYHYSVLKEKREAFLRSIV